MMNLKHVCAALIFISSIGLKPAIAYDEDTHFYGTYSMARYAGIHHNVAVKIALSAQWMDESFMSDPTSLIFLPITGIKKRRLLHFPSSRVSGTLNANVQQSTALGSEEISGVKKKILEFIVDYADVKQNLDTLTLFTKTQEGDAFASELLTEGLKEGNLMKAAASLHVIEDSYAHAGTPAEEGHRSFWHWPDRPFESYEKYDRMAKSAFAALVAIREMLPPEALDCQLVALSKNRPNCELPYPVLHKSYVNIPEVKKTVAYNILKHPEYVKTAMEDFYNRAIESQYIRNLTKTQFDSYVDQVMVTGEDDPYAILVKLTTILLNLEKQQRLSILNLPYVLKDTGKFGDLTAAPRTQQKNTPPLKRDESTIDDFAQLDIYEFIESHDFDDVNNEEQKKGKYFAFAKMISYDLLRWNVPLRLDEANRIEVENDKGIIRKKEMELRVRNMQTLIHTLYGINIKLVENHTKDIEGFGKEFSMNPEAEPNLPNDNQYVYATFNLLEKNTWNKMIFKFTLPLHNEEDYTDFVEFGAQVRHLETRSNEYWSKRAMINESDSNSAVKLMKKLKLDYDYFDIVGDSFSAANDMRKLWKEKGKKYFHDLFTSRLTPHKDNYVYRRSELVQEFKKSGKFRPLLTEEDTLWNSQTLRLRK